MRKACGAAILVAIVTVANRDARLLGQGSIVMTALQDELSRSMSDLRMKDAPAPYFISYEVQDRTVSDTAGRLGAVIEDAPRRIRVLRVEVRVGSYEFDNSRFVMQGFGGGGGSAIGETTLAPLEDDYDALRRAAWITTDEAYKRAVNTFARKRAAFQNRAVTTDVIPDFATETPVQTEVALDGDRSRRDMTGRVQQPSLALASSSDIDASEVSISEIHGTRYYLNSEGFKSVTPLSLASFALFAESQASDGMPIRETYTAVGKTIDELPPMSDLTARARELAARVSSSRSAPMGEEFTGPVLLEGSGSAEFIAETVLSLTLARRPPDAENPRAVPPPSTPFLTRTGLRVMADAFSVSDTPSLTTFNGKPVPGAYVVDDEGVRARDVKLVEKGRLVTLLTSRVPQKNFPHSNGHGRSGGAQAGVFQVESSQAIPAAELKDKYLALLKAQDKSFGYIVRGVYAMGGAGGPGIDRIVKVTLDGKEEPVRGLRFASVPSTAFRDLSEASQERFVFNYRAGLSTAVTVIAPSLIFEELELQRTREVLQKPPIVPSPLK